MDKDLLDKLKSLENLPPEEPRDIRETEKVVRALNEFLNSLSEEEKEIRNNRLRKIAMSLGKQREEVKLSFWQRLKNILA